MSTVQSAIIATYNGQSNCFDNLLENIIDANGDPVAIKNGLKATSSSDEDIASSSSKDEETDKVIYLKTR